MPVHANQPLTPPPAAPRHLDPTRLMNDKVETGGGERVEKSSSQSAAHCSLLTSAWTRSLRVKTTAIQNQSRAVTRASVSSRRYQMQEEKKKKKKPNGESRVVWKRARGRAAIDQQGSRNELGSC